MSSGFTHQRKAKVLNLWKGTIQSHNVHPITSLTSSPVTLSLAYSAALTLSLQFLVRHTCILAHLLLVLPATHSLQMSTWLISSTSSRLCSSLSVRPSWIMLFKNALPPPSAFYSFFSVFSITPIIYDTLIYIWAYHPSDMRY